MTTGTVPIIGRAWTPHQNPPAPLPAEARPALSRWVRRDGIPRGEIALGPLDPSTPAWEYIRFDGDGADEAARVLCLLDGERTLRDIAAASGQELEEVAGFVQNLYHRGAVIEESRAELPALSFYLHLRSTNLYATRNVGPSPFHARVDEGKLNRRLAIGFLLENFHFAAAASSHQGAAIAAMPTLRLKTAFSEHLSIEYWHHAWLRRGLLAAGLSDEDLERAVPLPSVMGLINHLRWLAIGDPLAYSAAIGVGEGDPDTLALSERFWEQFVALGVLPEDVYGPFREHDLGDAMDNHAEFGGEAFAEAGSLRLEDRARILRRVIYYTRLGTIWHEELVAFYGSEDGAPYFSVGY